MDDLSEMRDALNNFDSSFCSSGEGERIGVFPGPAGLLPKVIEPGESFSDALKRLLSSEPPDVQNTKSYTLLKEGKGEDEMRKEVQKEPFTVKYLRNELALKLNIESITNIFEAETKTRVIPLIFGSLVWSNERIKGLGTLQITSLVLELIVQPDSFIYSLPTRSAILLENVPVLSLYPNRPILTICSSNVVAVCLKRKGVEPLCLQLSASVKKTLMSESYVIYFFKP